MDYDPRVHVDSLMQAALHAAEPGAALARHWPQRKDLRLCRVLAAGKAASGMLAGMVRHGLCDVEAALMIGVPSAGGEMRTQGIPVEVFEADHPLPTERNVVAARRAAEFVERAKAPDGAALVVLLSGGASALMSLPAAGITLAGCRGVTSSLLRAGASIEELNTVRKHIEVLKGGGVARLAAPMPVWTFILSDVIGDDLASIGSGPTCADPTTFADALEVLARYAVRHAAPAVTRALEEGAAGRRPETVKPGDPVLANVHHRIIGNNAVAVDAVARRARSLGFEVAEVTYAVRGEAREFGKRLAEQAIRSHETHPGPSCIIAGGETTVTVRGSGTGGRNQELALAAAIEISGKTGVVVASFSTDGVDGPTDAAGAIATEHSVAAAARKGIGAQRCLDDNDSRRFFEAADSLIRSGPTGTNVNDVSVALVYPE